MVRPVNAAPRDVKKKRHRATLPGLLREIEVALFVYRKAGVRVQTATWIARASTGTLDLKVKGSAVTFQPSGR